MGIPESVIAWLFGQMLACFGIVYYGFTEDVRWYVAGSRHPARDVHRLPDPA